MLKFRATRVTEYETNGGEDTAKEVIMTETPAPEEGSGRSAVSFSFTLPSNHPVYKQYSTGVTFSLKPDAKTADKA